MTGPLIWPEKNSALPQSRLTTSLCTSAVMQASAIRLSYGKTYQLYFFPSSSQNTLSKPRRREQAHHNVSLPCLSTAAVEKHRSTPKYLKLHSCYTVGKQFFFLFQSKNMYWKRLKAFFPLLSVWAEGEKNDAQANRWACRDTITIVSSLPLVSPG